MRGTFTITTIITQVCFEWHNVFRLGRSTLTQTSEKNARLEALGWLNAPDPTLNQSEARRKRVADTGTWLLESDAYRAWFKGDLRMLWLYGKAGCCKTTLCSMIVDHVKDALASGEVMLYFYFTFNDTEKQTYKSLVLSLLAQLVQLELFHESFQLIQRNNQKHIGALEPMLFDMLNRCSVVYIIVDALDESPGGDEAMREEVLAGLKELFQRCPNVRVLLTSRRESDIEETLTDLQAYPMPILDLEVDADIQKYVAREVARDRKLQSLDVETRVEIEVTLTDKAGGM
jgi:hypothetical protein